MLMQLCRFVAKFMAMSMDEKAAQLISRAVEGRLLMWPDRRSNAAQDSSFMPIHAHLIRVSHSGGCLMRNGAEKHVLRPCVLHAAC
jgi:hypothetical protein